MGKLRWDKSILAAGLLLFGGFLGVLPITPVQAAIEPVTVRVGSYDNKPKIWMDENGTAQGIFPDILNAIAEKEGWKLEYVQGTWDEGMKRLEANEIDIMPDVALSDERLQNYDFNGETVLVSWAVLYSRRGVRISNMTDLDGKSIAVMTSGIIYSGPSGLKSLLDSFGIRASIIDVKVYDDVFRMLDENRADVGAVNHVFGITNEKNFAVKQTNIFFQPLELRFALTKGAEKNAFLVSHIDAGLQDLKRDPASIYHRSISRYLGGVVEEVEVFPRWFKYLASGALVLFAIVLGYVLVLRTVRGRLETIVRARTADLRREKEQFKSLFDGSNDALVLIDPSSMKVVECNAAAWRLIGYSKKGDLVGKGLHELSAPIQPDGRLTSEAAERMKTRVFIEGGALLDWVCRRADGTDVYTMITLTPLEWEGKKVVHVSLRDISDRKAAEARIQELDTLKNRFIQVVSHQLRTPLTSIRWSLEEILGEKFGRVDEKQRPLLNMALDSDTEVIRRISDLSDAMEIEEGNLRLTREPATFEDVVRSACISTEPLRAARRIKHVHEFADGQATKFSFDVGRIREVVTRLMDNASSYAKEGGTVIARVTVSRDFVHYEVSDDGIGIPKADQPHIFERFYRAANATAMRTDASGLSLYLAKSIVEAHGGQIGFWSEENRGASFWFELPLAR